MTQRNYEDPNYKKWRKEVYRRDGFKCRWPNCKARRGLNAHHIKTWAHYPGLRFDPNNGITLCRYHHKANPRYGRRLYASISQNTSP